MIDTPSSQDPVSIQQYRLPRPSVGRSAVTVRRYYLTHSLALLVPLLAGLFFFGPRSLAAVGVVVLSTLVSTLAWRRVGMRGSTLRLSHGCWQALLLGLMLPAELARLGGPVPVWPILPLAGVLLAMLNWLLGGLGAGRVHPVVTAYLLLTIMFHPLMMPRRLLQRSRTVGGDVMSSVDISKSSARLTMRGTDFIQGDWITREQWPNVDATIRPPAAETLGAFTSGRLSAERAWISLEGLVRDRLQPLEDLSLGAQPGGIGTSSAIAVVIGGLFLMYRGLIDYRVPLLITVSSMVGFMIFPIPTRIGSQVLYRWCVGHVYGIGWSLGLTVANYELLASPLLFTAFFLATAPSVCPLTRRGRAIFAIAVGFLSALLQLRLSVGFGNYLALLIASLITPSLDDLLHTDRMLRRVPLLRR